MYIAALGGTKGELNISQVFLKRLTLTGSTLRNRPVAEKGRIALALREAVWPLLEQRSVVPVIQQVLPLAQAVDAHRILEANDAMGKIVLRRRTSRMSDKALLQRFDDWRRAGRPLALATVVATAGSTYTKPGHRILIAGNGDYQGLVSGGCLEGDLAAHARDVIASGTARVITYDLRGDADELFGLGIGCDGLLKILLQQLLPQDDYAPFAAIAAALRADVPAHCAVVLAERGSLRLGTTLITPGWCVQSARPGVCRSAVHATQAPAPPAGSRRGTGRGARHHPG